LEVAAAWLFMDVLEPSNWSQGFTDGEQRLLEQIQQGLTLTADLSRADIMLLVKQKDAARVIAQAQPHSIASLYRNTWLGRSLPFDDHPLLAAGLNYGRNGQRQENLLDQGTPVVRQVLPVLSEAGRTIAALQVETNLIAWERQKRRDLPFRRAVEWLQSMELRGDLSSGARLGPFGEWDGVLFVDEGYRIRYVSGIANNLYRRLGYLDDLHGKHIGDLNTKDEVLIRDAFRTQQCQEHQVVEGNRQWTRKVVPIWSYAPGLWPLGHKGRARPLLRGALVLVHDDTEALEKAVQLEVLSTMIKEVHHRVKNNLQTVASILRMQSRRSTNPDVQLQLTEAVNRVLAVAVIHEFLSRESDQSINIREVCQRIVTQTQRAAVLPDKEITLRIQGPSIYLPSQQATACALVANELLLNAVEHAFEGRDKGTVLLTLADEGNQVVMEVADDGVGLPEETGSDPAASLGLTIVRTLVQGDLKGQFVMERATPGTRAIVTFKKDLPSGP
jgi:two-component system, sensor histidine kinase PdtaS